MTNSQHINLDYLKATCGNSVDMIRSIIQMFIESTPESLAEMKENIEEGNREQLKRNAHKIKSSFMMFGAKKIGDTLQEIELSALDASSSELSSLLTEIENKMDSIINELITV